MITKEQALTYDYFIQVYRLSGANDKYTDIIGLNTLTERVKIANPKLWSRNGKTQTWKTRPDAFKIPVKHGLYSYGYITQDNCHLFDIQG